MEFTIEIKDDTAKAMMQIAENKRRALVAMGIVGAGAVKGYKDENRPFVF